MKISSSQIATLSSVTFGDEAFTKLHLLTSKLGPLAQSVASCPDPINNLIIETAAGQAFVGWEIVAAHDHLFWSNR